MSGTEHLTWRAYAPQARAGVLRPSGRGKRPPVQVLINKRVVEARSHEVALFSSSLNLSWGAALAAGGKASISETGLKAVRGICMHPKHLSQHLPS